MAHTHLFPLSYESSTLFNGPPTPAAPPLRLGLPLARASPQTISQPLSGSGPVSSSTAARALVAKVAAVVETVAVAVVVAVVYQHLVVNQSLVVLRSSRLLLLVVLRGIGRSPVHYVRKARGYRTSLRNHPHNEPTGPIPSKGRKVSHEALTSSPNGTGCRGRILAARALAVCSDLDPSPPP